MASALKLPSLVYNVLIRSMLFCDRRPPLRRLWNNLWQAACKLFRSPVTTSIHGRAVTVNFGYMYPVFARQFRNYNNPLIELVYQAYSTEGRPVSVIDVGANIGDTVLLLEANCPGMVSEFYCVEGDPEFFEYLLVNTAGRRNVRSVRALLSSSQGYESELVRMHGGTSSAVGEIQAAYTTLDLVLENEGIASADILKIDVDGYDGKVLGGAGALLKRSRPAVIFEWDPSLCAKTGNDWTDHFRLLERSGYDRFIWFTKFGDFSHFTDGFEEKAVERLSELCLRNNYCPGWHYDVVALHPESAISPVRLAELVYSRKRKSRY